LEIKKIVRTFAALLRAKTGGKRAAGELKMLEIK
jgi:hypothetical protein